MTELVCALLQSKGSGTSIKGKSALAEFCRDLCEEARCGRIDPVRLIWWPALRLTWQPALRRAVQ